MNKRSNCDIIIKSIKGAINIMNRNSIISLAMIYALWQSNKQDLLDLIRPFVVYAVGCTTKKGEEIKADIISRFMEDEFGYRSFNTEVVNRILKRETGSKQIEKRNNIYYLVGSYQEQVNAFDSKRIFCKSHSDRVTKELADFLNDKSAKGRNNYTQKDAEVFLLAFFEKQGGSVVLSVDDLRQIVFKDNEIDYYIGRFILKAKEDQSILLDYIVELVKGFFVTTALYLQAENQNVTSAAFSNVTFYLDTPLLLGLLGYKTKETNNSIQETISCLIKHGAKIAYFDYNANEVYNILEAYKQSIIANTAPSVNTLEYFDEIGAGYSVVDYEQRRFGEYLEQKGLEPASFASVLANSNPDDFRGALDTKVFKNIVLSIKPTYNFTNDDDIDAIDSVSRVRKGQKLPYIEKCKAVFVTNNTVLVAATKQYSIAEKIDFGFPLVITGEDLCIIAWLKEFGQNSDLPRMRLLENVLAAVTPNQDVLVSYFSILDTLKKKNNYTPEEVKLLQIDIFARNELMERTHGVSRNVTENTVEEIRQKIKEDSYQAGFRDATQAALVEARNNEQMAQKKRQNVRNAICKKAEEEVTIVFAKKQRINLILYRVFSILFAIGFIAVTVMIICLQKNITGIVLTSIASIITSVEAVLPFCKKETWLTKLIKRHFDKKMQIAFDEKKTSYLEAFDEQESIE